MIINNEKFNILELIQKKIMKLFEYHLKIKNLKFCIENTINDEKLLVNNDKSKIERMIINLMSNAIKFTFIG